MRDYQIVRVLYQQYYDGVYSTNLCDYERQWLQLDAGEICFEYGKYRTMVYYRSG